MSAPKRVGSEHNHVVDHTITPHTKRSPLEKKTSLLCTEILQAEASAKAPTGWRWAVKTFATIKHSLYTALAGKLFRAPKSVEQEEVEGIINNLSTSIFSKSIEGRLQYEFEHLEGADVNQVNAFRMKLSLRKHQLIELGNKKGAPHTEIADRISKIEHLEEAAILSDPEHQQVKKRWQDASGEDRLSKRREIIAEARKRIVRLSSIEMTNPGDRPLMANEIRRQMSEMSDLHEKMVLFDGVQKDLMNRRKITKGDHNAWEAEVKERIEELQADPIIEKSVHELKFLSKLLSLNHIEKNIRVGGKLTMLPVLEALSVEGEVFKQAYNQIKADLNSGEIEAVKNHLSTLKKDPQNSVAYIEALVILNTVVPGQEIDQAITTYIKHLDSNLKTALKEAKSGNKESVFEAIRKAYDDLANFQQTALSDEQLKKLEDEVKTKTDEVFKTWEREAKEAVDSMQKDLTDVLKKYEESKIEALFQKKARALQRMAARQRTLASRREELLEAYQARTLTQVLQKEQKEVSEDLKETHHLFWTQAKREFIQKEWEQLERLVMLDISFFLVGFTKATGAYPENTIELMRDKESEFLKRFPDEIKKMREREKTYEQHQLVKGGSGSKELNEIRQNVLYKKFKGIAKPFYDLLKQGAELPKVSKGRLDALEATVSRGQNEFEKKSKQYAEETGRAIKNIDIDIEVKMLQELFLVEEELVEVNRDIEKVERFNQAAIAKTQLLVMRRRVENNPLSVEEIQKELRPYFGKEEAESRAIDMVQELRELARLKTEDINE